MNGATGNVPSYVCVAGDQFILKGGVTWNYTVLPWIFPCSGTSNNRVYIGADPGKTWYDATACSLAGYRGFCRPIINGGGATGCGGSPCYDVTTKTFTNFEQAYWDMDNLEMTGLYWGGHPGFGQGFYINAHAAHDFDVRNSYFHGWSHAPYPTASEGDGSSAVIYGSTSSPSGNTNSCMHDSVVDGSDTGKDSFGVSYGGPPCFYNNYIDYAWSDAFNGGYSSFHDNTLMHLGQSFASGGGIHENTFESNTDSGGYALVYNNFIAHSATGVIIWMAPQSGQTSFFINNILADINAPAGDNILMCEKALSNPGGGCVYLNNTVECGPDSNPSLICGSYDSSGVAAVNMNNNHMITSGTCPTLSKHGTGSTSSTYATNICQTKATANGQGYTINQTYPFSPITSNSATVGKGVNLSSIATGNLAALASDSAVGVGYDTVNHKVIVPNRVSNSRSGVAWDVGAYLWPTGGAVVPNPPSGLTAVVR
jgi:hypothetical protein